MTTPDKMNSSKSVFDGFAGFDGKGGYHGRGGHGGDQVTNPGGAIARIQKVR